MLSNRRRTAAFVFVLSVSAGGLIWSFAGDDNRNEFSLTNIQPFVAYVTPESVTYSVNVESTYNHEAASGQEWSVPINLMISKLLRLGS